MTSKSQLRVIVNPREDDLVLLDDLRTGVVFTCPSYSDSTFVVAEPAMYATFNSNGIKESNPIWALNLNTFKVGAWTRGTRVLPVQKATMEIHT